MSRRPHILFLSQCLPYPPHSGATNRTFNILKQLQKEFDITLLAFSRVNHQPDANARQNSRRALEEFVHHVSKPVSIPSQHSIGRRLWDHMRSVRKGRPYTFYEYWSKEFDTQLQECVPRGSYDLIHLDSLDLHRWLTDLPPVVKVCTHHSIESELLRLRAHKVKSRLLCGYILHQANLMEKMERELCARFGANVMMSDVDAAKLRKLAPDARTIVVPNGVDTDYFAPRKTATPVPGRAIFLGPTYVFPNRDAIEYLLGNIWPNIRAVTTDAWLQLVGKCSESERQRYNTHPGVTSVGFVEDIRPHMASASVSVVPIRVGGGTRLKILDSWAMGKAVVSTSIGCEGLNAEDGKNILIRDTPEAFADGVLEVLSNSELRSELEVNGRKTAEETYSWEIVGQDMRACYWQLLQGA